MMGSLGGKNIGCFVTILAIALWCDDISICLDVGCFTEDGCAAWFSGGLGMSEFGGGGVVDRVVDIGWND